jgi:rubrerythrin
MKTEIATPRSIEIPSRRKFLVASGGATLSAAAVAMLAGGSTLIQPTRAYAANATDLGILNTALGAELQAIAAYQLGAESGLLKPDVKTLAVTFQGHHKQHADLLRSTVKTLGGTPVEAMKDYGFPADTLKSQTDVLQFAAGLEKGAVSAYLGAVGMFDNRDLAKAAASILGDEAMHWAVLRAALGQPPVPSAFME